jgi:hypothetical protein
MLHEWWNVRFSTAKMWHTRSGEGGGIWSGERAGEGWLEGSVRGREAVRVREGALRRERVEERYRERERARAQRFFAWEVD